MIEITQAALNEVLRRKSKQNDPDLLFRLAVKSGGCCDWVYQFGFESLPGPTDVVGQCGPLQVVTDRESLPYIEGLTLDYSEDLMGGGFRFDNPNAARTCGCGHSFVSKS
ncbi:iron-sulfur cluster assembly accessory protein [Lyngbya sp. CCY1209]|uniref:HesB/IscA family protein n=1 Tax=Lyngbya sp. CCY1209 TaxID=2886103 RepID=UPI002D211B3B|nr:iron-sulfur cluster assembly accessory protein [Lyngbya sp. CCY1209]MEB3882485.1 iron-sulfur cluster assembly accessory protein [Lyngbya sp. CCY1209]